MNRFGDLLYQTKKSGKKVDIYEKENGNRIINNCNRSHAFIRMRQN